MFGKVMVRKKFTNVVNYVLNKEKEARIIAAQGVLASDAAGIVASFEIQADMRPALTNKVGHIALSFSPNDKDRCTDDFICEVAEKYMAQMGIRDTQYIIVRHFDHAHPHAHIVYNRVDNNGKTISDSNQRVKNKKACKALTVEYGLHIANGKEHVNRDRLRQPDKSRYAIYDAITEVLPSCCSWKQFCEALSERNISVELVNKGKTDEVQGVVFILDGYRFTGSKVDRKYSYSKLKQKIDFNNAKRQREINTRLAADKAEAAKSKVLMPNPSGRLNAPMLPVAGNSRNAEYEINSQDSDYDDEQNIKRRSGYHY